MLIILIAAVYLLPTIVAVFRAVPARREVILVNVLLSWTVIGWFYAFWLAVRHVPERAPG